LIIGPRAARRLASLCLFGATALGAAAAPAAEPGAKPRPLEVDDYFAIGQVGDPQISPDGYWIAYTVGTSDLEADESRTRIWMVPAAGGEAVPLTAEDQHSSSPRWSPDGRYLAFLSARGGDGDAEARTQLWTLFRGGGEAEQLTDTAQGVEYFAWSPDGSRVLLVLRDPSPEDLEAKAAREEGRAYDPETRPWVVTRQQFKQDYVGYLERRWNHLYVLDLASREIRQITSGETDDYCQAYLPGCDHSRPAWSPDGRRVAFVSNRTGTPDANYNTDIWVVDAANQDKGAELVQVTRNPGPDGAPSWSLDGKLIAHISNLETGAGLYGTSHLAVSPSAGGPAKVLTRDLDRNAFQPRFSRRDASIYFLLEDSGEQSLARVSAAGGAVERIIRGSRAVYAFDEGPAGELAATISEPQQPAEVFLLRDGNLKQQSHVNDALMASLRLGAVEEIQFASKDGTPIEAFVVVPPGFRLGKARPGILRIHGGPQAQYDYGFHFEAQLYAANGYVVVLPNPRGSTGYGQDFCLAIWQDWGGPDYEDVMAAVDAVIARGWVDPQRMAVTGWSYGGMLTNHVITKTDRFKAAATGASAALYVTNFGHDQYQRWWAFELGMPWKPEDRAIYERMSPFNDVEKVVTPTLILGGEIDWNVPIINSEQLFLALEMLGVPTELVVYPGEYHGIGTPSHVQDLYGRYLEWFDRWVLRGGAERSAK